ncbi:hypothetical protein FY036_23125 [Mesorhizobium microcysteis]|uniref:Uncharacterized protein n=1 Tax=Neoaquamicrobium microcysteis TaxID=2682781 RepID=A0A5D4GP85_9HYPH|nr:hypothetical protein [Mesorhizobium microcysteis]TYR29733.1 hypothetical protein FY036_23125 [Mesorhizobium microcysteis]
MDWNRAIERNREALGRVLAMLVAMAGLAAGQSKTAGPQSGSTPAAGGPPDCRLPSADCRPTLPRHLHRAVLRLLRPAESAARRLIIVMARELPDPELRGQSAGLEGQRGTEPHPPAHSHKARLARRRHRDEAGRRKPVPALPLFDPLPRWRATRRSASPGVPRISLPGYTVPAPIAPRLAPMPHDAIDAARLGQRLHALEAALDDLPGHARRFVRWRARRDAGARRGVARRVWPLRPGRPPGWRRPGLSRRGGHEIHVLLDDLHGVALMAMERADTS